MIHLMHREVNMDCMYVRKSDTMGRAELAMGGFRSAQHGRVDVRNPRAATVSECHSLNVLSRVGVFRTLRRFVFRQWR